MLESHRTIMILVDVQSRLAQVMHERDRLLDNLQRLVRGLQALETPILWCEQNPERMGRTVSSLAALLPDHEPIGKLSFSCLGEPRLADALRAARRDQVLLAGIEAHVCVYQTAMDLLAAGYEVEVVVDAVDSRTPTNRELGIRRVVSAGARPTSVEMALFELMRTADHAAFRTVLQVVK